MNKSEIKSCYRGFLHAALASENYNQGQIDSMVGQFDETCKTTEFETAFALTLDAYGSVDVQRACRTVSDYIARQMEKYNASHQGITNDHPLERLRRTIKKYNDNLQVLEGVTVESGGKIHTLTQDELDNQVKAHLPHCMKKLETLTANASENHPLPRARAAKSLSIEVRYF